MAQSYSQLNTKANHDRKSSCRDILKRRYINKRASALNSVDTFGFCKSFQKRSEKLNEDFGKIFQVKPKKR